MGGLLEGKAVVVTGAGGGLGRAYALAAAQAGARLVLVDRTEAALTDALDDTRRAGAAAIAFPGDISAPDVGRGAVQACLAAYGRIDGLVNNAGIPHVGYSWEASDEEVARLFGVNVLGVIAATTAALPAMVSQGAGSVVNVISGALVGMPGMALYGGSKGAVLGLTYGWAIEAADTGVRVNAISPLANTAMSAQMTDIPEHLKGPDPHAIAPAVVALLADGAAHLNGQIVRFDGTRLGLMSPPGKGPGTRRERWDARGVLAAFDGELRDDRQRVGLGSA